ncbi:MAG TPA: protoporphyrinogen oxidase [Elusimicrobia bacterium]|nr:MAG: protoporphyrinogen oxidase [Elusimicrobia bacterium GWA2_66_18]OGR68496.1 MAG: protoporphyrinogen oxidase [Elusimicrobia bacterium GWC2_65_9]HAZ07094.1 protoporphyrinogen oxidase [Elusimicrobiota bacterium]
MRSGRSESPRKVVVIGAGVTGLTAARELARGRGGRPAEVVVLEASPRVGGKVRTEQVDGAPVETGPDSFVTLKPEMLDLVKELGLQDELVCTGADPTVSVFKGGRLVPLPAGMNLVSPTKLLPFALSTLFSMRGKLRMALEPLIPAGKSLEDESLADFARRRLGAEALEVLVGPMLAGIYAGDPEKMSIKSTFPQLLEMEKRGGLVRSMWLGAPKRARREGITTFMTIKNGLSRVMSALERSLPSGAVRTDCPVRAVRRRGGRWEVATPQGTFEADVVVAAVPASALADCVEGLDAELAIRLREIPFVSTATTTLIYDAATFPLLPKGFGFLIPREAGSTLAAATYSSSKFPSRSPSGKVVIRAFIGGAGREESAEGPLSRIEESVRCDLHKVLGIKGVSPIAAKTARWIKGNPQYNVGHARRLERLGSCLKSHPGLILAGCSYRGVGLPDCVRSGRRAAELASPTRSGREHDTAHAGLA